MDVRASDMLTRRRLSSYVLWLGGGRISWMVRSPYCIENAAFGIARNAGS